MLDFEVGVSYAQSMNASQAHTYCRRLYACATATPVASPVVDEESKDAEEWNDHEIQIYATRFSDGQVGRLTNVVGTFVSPDTDLALNLGSSSGVDVMAIQLPVPISFFLERELKGDA